MATFCLIHSSVQGPDGWSLLVDALEQRGHRSITPDLGKVHPESLALAYAEAVAGTLKREISNFGEELWLVAHSASGLFLPWIVDLIPEFRLRGLVYVAAYVPMAGTSLLGSLSADPSMFNPDWIGRNPMDDSVALEFLFHDCEQSIVEWALGTRRLMIAGRAMTEVMPATNGNGPYSAYILCSDDRTLTPAWMKNAAHVRLGVDPFAINGGHCPQVSRPGELADILSALSRPAHCEAEATNKDPLA
jgi:pimeloyl-ACP methyl ester carboxylesterase